MASEPPTRRISKLVLLIASGLGVFALGFATRDRGAAVEPPAKQPAVTLNEPQAAEEISLAPIGPVTLDSLLEKFDPLRPMATRAGIDSLVRNLDEVELEQLLRTTLEMDPTEPARAFLISGISQRWAMFDPEAVIAFAIKNGGEGMAAGFGELTEIAPQRSRELALQVSQDDVEHYLSNVLTPMINTLAGTDPRMALEMLKDRELISEKLVDRLRGEVNNHWAGRLLGKVYLRWSERDPAAAAASLSRELGTIEPWMASGIAENWTRIDPQAAADWAATLPSGQTQQDALEGVMEVSIKHDGGTFILDWLPKFFKGRLPETTLHNLGYHLAKHDADAGLRWLSTLTANDQKTAAYSVVPQLDSERISDLMGSVDEEIRADVVNSIAGLRREEHSAALLAWAESIPAGKKREAMIKAIARANPIIDGRPFHPSEAAAFTAKEMLINQGGEAAGEWIGQIEESELRDSALKSMATEWAATDPASATAYVHGFKNGDANWTKRTLDIVAMKWLAAEPEAATEWLEANGLGRYVEKMQVAQITGLARQGKLEEAGAGLVEAITNGIGSSSDYWNSANRIAIDWTKRDPAAAAAWALTVDDQSARELAVARVGQGWALFDPDASLAWALTINDPKIREKAVEGTFDHWVDYDLEAATTALQQAGLTESERTAVLKHFPEL